LTYLAHSGLSEVRFDPSSFQGYEQAPSEHRCRATNKHGQACRSTIVGADGYCSAHSGRDMRELGRLGGQSSGRVKPESVPQSLREELRTLDPKIVRGAVEQALTGGNEAARVSAVKLLADLDVYGGKECPVCAKTAAIDMGEVRAKVDRLIARDAAALAAAQVEERAEQQAQERLAALKQEHALG
jgi:hypothetical protein